MLKKAFILLFFSILIGSNLKAQNDSLYHFIKADVLDVENLVNWQDSVSIQVVSASRSAKNIEDIPVPIYVITHEEIQRNHYTSLTDILKHLPGIRVSQPGSGDIGEIFQFRGLIGNYYTKILVNNIPVKPSVVTGMPIAAQLPIRQAERIEIIYGPAAAMYGADAVTGVINIITKDADKGTFVRGDISMGEYEYNYINFMIGGKAGKNKNIMQYSFYGSKSEFNNMNINATNDVYNPLYYLQKKNKPLLINGTEFQPLDINQDVFLSEGISEEDFISQFYYSNYEGSYDMPDMQEIPSASHQIGIELKYRGFNFSYNNMYRRAHSSIGRSSYLYKYNNSQNYWGEKIERTCISYEKRWEKFTSSSSLSYLAYRMDNNSSFGLTFMSNQENAYFYSASDDISAEQILIYTPIPNLEIVSGASIQLLSNMPVTNYLSEPFKNSEYQPFSSEEFDTALVFHDFGLNQVNYYNASTFLQFYYVLNKLTLMGGFRYEGNSLYGTNFNPRIAMLYKLGKRTSITASYGNAYKAPAISMAYQSLSYAGGVNNDSVYYQVIPNTKLEPEYFQAYDFGIRRRFFRNIYVDLAFFYNEIDNLIVDTYVPIDKDKYPLAITTTDSLVRTKINSNQAKSTLYGVQANIKFKNMIESVKLNMELNVMLAEKSDKLPEIGSIIGSFELMPNHIGQLRISFEPNNRFFVQFDNVWMSKWLRVLIPFEEIYDDPYESVDGYYTLDALVNFSVSDKLRAYVKFNNIFDEKYGGLNATGTDADLPYNPQLGSNIRLGLTYNFN